MAGQEFLAGHCTVTEAYICHEVNEAAGMVTFGFLTKAPRCTADSPFGAAFWIDGKKIGGWRQGDGGSAEPDAAEYSIRGAAWVPAPYVKDSNGDNDDPDAAGEDSDVQYFFEIEISNRESSGNHAAFLQPFRTLEIQLIDPESRNSRAFPYPIIVEPPLAAEAPTTMEKTTAERTAAAKAPTTTTTKAFVSATPAATTQKARTTQTFASFVWTGTKTTAAKATAAPTQAAAQPAQAAQQMTDIIWYTVPIPAASQAVSQESAQSREIDDALLAYQMDAAQAGPGEAAPAAPVFLEDDAGARQPVSLRAPLFGAAGFLLALALLLFFMWLKGQGYLGKAPVAVAAEDDDNEEIDDALED